MAEILGVGCTHRPLMLRPNEDWTFMLRAALDDPDMPAEMKNPANWPAPLRQELGESDVTEYTAGSSSRSKVLTDEQREAARYRYRHHGA